MARSRFFAATVWFITITAAAADSPEIDHEIEGIVRLHAEATLKAEQLRLRTVEKSRQDAVASLTRLAAKAYSKKDRFGETSAWKSVLRFDRDNKKATQYFADLGNLDKVVAELPGGELAAPEVQLSLNGRWSARWDHQGTFLFTVADNVFTIHEKNGKTTKGSPIKAGLISGAPTLVTKHDEWIDRLTLAGDKILIEEWFPASTYPKEPPRNFGYAVRITD